MLAIQPQLNKISYGWPERPIDRVVFLLLLAVILFNPVLAIVNSHLLRLSNTQVIIAELVLDLIALLLILVMPRKNDRYFIFVVLSALILSILVFSYSQNLDFKSLRDFAVVILFWKIGMSTHRSTYFALMKYAAALVLLVSLVEIFIPGIYTAVLNPAAYYFQTRGVAGDSSAVDLSGGEFGLYKTTDGYGSRFSINFLSDHRLSSIFLEPVSFGNFIVIALVFCIAYWKYLPTMERLLYLSVFFIGTVGSDSRTATIISGIILLYVPLSKKFGGSIAMFYIPGALLLSCMLCWALGTTFFADTLGARVSWSGYLLLNSSIEDLIFGNLHLVGMKLPDAGIFYVIATHTIFGLLLLMSLGGLSPRTITAQDRGLIHGLMLFFAAKMLISSSLFSMKVSPFLWLGIGFVVGGGINKARQQTSTNRALATPSMQLHPV